MTAVRLRMAVLVAVDVLTMTAVWAFDLWLYWAIGLGRYRYGWAFYLRLWPALVAFVILNAAFRLYHGRAGSPATPISPVEEMRRLFVSALLTHIGVIAVIALTHQTLKETSRVVIVVSGLLVGILAQPVRDLVRSFLFRVRAFRIPVAVLGPAPAVQTMTASLMRDAYVGFVPVSADENPQVLVSCEGLDDFQAHYPDYVKRYAHIGYFPSAGSLPVADSRPISIDGLGGIEFVNQRKMRLLRTEKWILDKVLASVVFVCTLPLFVLLPILIKLTSRGPVFYRHDRLGKMGRPLRVW